MGKKEVFTRIDEELYKKIKERGYKISELIRLGFEYKEKQGNILTEEGVKRLLEELKSITEDMKSTLSIIKVFKEKIKEINLYTKNSKSKIASKFFPSKYDMINILEEIEKKLSEVLDYLK